MSALLQIKDIKKTFPVRKGVFQRIVGQVTAVKGLSLEVQKGKTMGLVGESGCGKSTLAKMLVGLIEPTAGEIIFDGETLVHKGGERDMAAARQVQIVFQDPFSSLDPRRPVGNSIAEALVVHSIGDAQSQRQAVSDMLELVGLPPQAADRFPHEFSGGQRQRIGIARALIMKPAFVVCDEPTSALDVSVQAQILNLLRQLQSELDLTLMFISHNLSVVRHVADDVMVMYLGSPVEVAAVEQLFSNPRHPYTRALLSATPVADPEKRSERIRLVGELPSPINPPSGCTFHPRCPLANDRCKQEVPRLADYGDAIVACHAVEEGREGSAQV
jgi:peptide/nickel transport system ATP-binding protein